MSVSFLVLRNATGLSHVVVSDPVLAAELADLVEESVSRCGAPRSRTRRRRISAAAMAGFRATCTA